ncbi:MAG: hypothetical protein J5824_05495 [Lachnospiraceae bacterium]|nr:hypothetical protein [Lachnospiraceae bacterium]
MSKNSIISYFFILLLAVSLIACNKKEDESGKNVNETGESITADQLDTIKPDQISSWAAIYESDKEILSFEKGGTAVYKGTEYDSYLIDDNFITFQGKEELKSRYVMKRKKMLLYETKEYQRETVEGAYQDVPEGSVEGLWSFDENVSFEFTEKGTFYEDRNFPGHYLVDEEAHTIKLMYNDHFEDIYLYYTIEGDVMKIEYPWSLVPTEVKQE